MSTDMISRIESTSSEDTERIAAELGARLRGGEVIVLSSDLGGGKTTFVRGLARGMGSTAHVASPTFTISRTYKAPRLTLYHFDFYRLTEPGIIANELAEYLDDPDAVIAIEWGGIVETVLPNERLDIKLTPTGETGRSIQLTSTSSLKYLLPEEVKL